MPTFNNTLNSPGVLPQRFRSLRNLICALGLYAVASALPAATVGYWEFEADGFLGDSSGNGYSLTETGTTGGINSYALPATGAGSAFPSTILDQPNTNATQGAGTGNTFGTYNFTAPSAVRDTLNGTTTFTLEAFVNLADDTGGTKTIAGLGGGQTDGAWSFGVSSSESLFFQYAQSTGAWGTPGQLVTLHSGFTMAVDKDYYVAIAFDLNDLSENGAVFYVQNLTDGGELQMFYKSRSTGQDVIVDTTYDLTIGNSITATPWRGVLDNIRISDTQLGQSELLISNIPEGSSASILGIAVLSLVIAVRMRNRRASSR